MSKQRDHSFVYVVFACASASWSVGSCGHRTTAGSRSCWQVHPTGRSERIFVVLAAVVVQHRCSQLAKSAVQTRLNSMPLVPHSPGPGPSPVSGFLSSQRQWNMTMCLRVAPSHRAFLPSSWQQGCCSPPSRQTQALDQRLWCTRCPTSRLQVQMQLVPSHVSSP